MNNFDEEEYDSSADDVLEEIENQQAEQEAAEDAVETVLSNAIERIEEANVWKLLISQDVIENGSASTRVVKSVNSQLKRFGLERLELLLGMREPKIEKTQIEVKSQFDSEEEKALKILAAKMLGRSIATVLASSENTPKIATVSSEAKEPRLKTVTAPIQRQPSLATAQPKPKVKQKAPTLKQGGRTAVPSNVRADKGFALPAGVNPRAMPRADVLQGSGPVGMSMTVDPGLGSGYNTQSSNNILGSIINQLTGGSPIHVDNSAPSSDQGDNANERF